MWIVAELHAIDESRQGRESEAMKQENGFSRFGAVTDSSAGLECARVWRRRLLYRLSKACHSVWL